MSATMRQDWPAQPGVDSVHRQVVENLDQGVYFVDRRRTIRYWSPGAAGISGYVADDVLGSRCYDNILNHVDESGRVLCFDGCPLAGTMEDGQPREVVVYLRHREGHRVPVQVRATAIRDDAGEIVGAAEVFRDVRGADAARREMEELRRLAYVDPLTGLPNRRRVEREIAGRLDSLSRRGWSTGILIADLDDLKAINDQYGHGAGDIALQVTARTIGNARAEDFAGRWGGDEFVVVLAGVDATGLARAARRISALVGRSRARHGGVEIPLAISIGGAIGRRGDTVETVFARADAALYRAKAAGRNQVSLAVEPPDGPSREVPADPPGTMYACRQRVLALWPGIDRGRLARARNVRAIAQLAARGTGEPLEVVLAMLGPACQVEPTPRPRSPAAPSPRTRSRPPAGESRRA